MIEATEGERYHVNAIKSRAAGVFLYGTKSLFEASAVTLRAVVSISSEEEEAAPQSVPVLGMVHDG